MKRWYCEQCRTGPSQARSWTANGLSLCHDCFFMFQAREALEEHANKPIEKILSRVLKQDLPYYDLIGKWLETCCRQDSAHWTASKELYTSYATWCTANSYKPCNSAAFKRLLGDHGLPIECHRNHALGIQGLHLTNS